MDIAEQATIGYSAEEIDITSPTRAARLKWVIVVNDSIPAGQAVNAAICAAGATTAAVGGLLGPEAVDAAGVIHPGLPWAGCSILAADADTLRAIRAEAATYADTFIADMPAAAQKTRVYGDYLAVMASDGPETIDYLAVSLVGPRNRIDKIVGRLPLMP